MSSFDKVVDLLVHFAGLDRTTADEQTLRKLNRFALAIFSAGIHQAAHDLRPDLLEAELERLRTQISALAHVIGELNPWAAAVARQEAGVAKRMKAGMPEDLARQQSILDGDLADEPVDQLAIAALTELNHALKQPIERLIHKSRPFPTGKGKKPDLVARKIALIAGQALLSLGEKKLSYWKGSSTYAKLCEALFHEFGVRAEGRRACEWAVSELEKKGQL